MPSLREADLEEEVKIRPMATSTDPLIGDLVGKIKTVIEDISLSMDSERVYRTMGVSPDKTFLLESKPGMGKTMGIKALNNTRNKDVLDCFVENYPRVCQQNNQAIKYEFEKQLESKNRLFTFAYDIGNYGTAYINMGAVKVQSFFNKALKYTYSGKPVLIMFDECDAILSKRSDGIHSEDKKVLETIMKNLQIAHDLPGAYIVLMTNTAGDCDEASLRAGRIDKRYKLELPNETERKIAFEKARDKINNQAGYQVVRGMSPEILAEMSNGFSYADIFQIVESTVRKRALEISRERTDNRIRSGYVGQVRLENLLKEHQQAFYPTKSMGFGK